MTLKSYSVRGPIVQAMVAYLNQRPAAETRHILNGLEEDVAHQEAEAAAAARAAERARIKAEVLAELAAEQAAASKAARQRSRKPAEGTQA